MLDIISDNILTQASCQDRFPFLMKWSGVFLLYVSLVWSALYSWSYQRIDFLFFIFVFLFSASTLYVSALCHRCLVKSVLLVLPMNGFSVFVTFVRLFPQLQTHFLFISQSSNHILVLPNLWFIFEACELVLP